MSVGKPHPSVSEQLQSECRFLFPLKTFHGRVRYPKWNSMGTQIGWLYRPNMLHNWHDHLRLKMRVGVSWSCVVLELSWICQVFFKNTRGNSIHREFQVPSSGSFKLKHNHDNDSIRFDGNPMSLSVYILPRWRCCLSENLKQMSHLAMGENLDIN